MLFTHVIILILCSSKVISEVSGVPAGDLTHMIIPHSLNTPLQEPQCNLSAPPKRSLKIHLPFMDMEIQNHRNLHVVQEEGRQHLFVLHGHELFRLFVSRHEKRLVLIGNLGGSVRELEPLHLEIIAWRDYYLVAVALDGYIEIYQISTDTIRERLHVVADPNRRPDILPTFSPIQQLTLFGRYQKMFLTEADKARVVLIVAVNFTKLHGKFRTFEWLNTYFETIEELTVPQIDVPQMVGTHPKYLISGKSIRHQARIILTIYELRPGALHLQAVQTITVNGKLIYTTTYGGRNFLVTCAKKSQKCHIFVMREGQFVSYKRRSWPELAFEKFSSMPKHFLVGLTQHEVRVFTNGRLDCFSSFTTPQRDADAVLTHSNEVGEDYILLLYRRPFFALVRMVQVEVLGKRNVSNTEEPLGSTLDTDETNTVQRHRHLFEDTIGKLRRLLLQRKMSMDVLRQVSGVFAPRHTSMRVDHEVQVKEGNIGIIQVVGEHLQSPMQLLQRVASMRASLNESKRMRRSANGKDLKVRKLKVRNLVYGGSVLEGFSLDRALAMLSVRRKLYARSLRTKELLRNKWQRLARQLKGQPLRVNKLQVQRVNGIDWNELHDMWFLRNRDTKLQGNLILQAATEVQHIETALLNGLAVDELINLRMPQQIHTNILISRFYVRDLNVQQLNGLDFANDVVFSGRDDYIQTPVQMYQLSVKGDLELTDETKDSRDADVQTPKLQQYYTKPVIINGSLTVNNLLRETNETRLLVAGQPLSLQDIRVTYLLHNETQNFATPVHFGNAKVFAPELKTKYLNEHATEQHLLNSDSLRNATPDQPIYLVFMQAHIEGDLNCTDYQTKLRDLQLNAIKHGDVVNITGTKYFEGPLSVDHLMTLQLNELPVQDLVLQSHLQRQDVQFTGTKTFETISVRDVCHIEKHANATYLNNLPLNELLNYDYYYDALNVTHQLKVHNVVIHSLNGIPIEEVLSKFRVSDDVLMLHKDLIVEGNVEFSENLRVAHINDIAWFAYEKSLVKLDDVDDGAIETEVHFTEELTVTAQLVTPTVNGVLLEEIFENVLRKSAAQLITGEYTFDTVRASNVDVSLINGIPTASFIDTTKEIIEIDGDLKLPHLIVQSEVSGNLWPNFDYAKLKEHLQLLTEKGNWLNLYVHGDCNWRGGMSASLGTQYTHLEYLLKNAVRQSQEQQISGNVHMKSSPRIKKMRTVAPFPIYDELQYIARDCLLRNSTHRQVIGAHKTFMKPLQMQSVTISGNLAVKMLNGIDVERFNNSLYRLSTGNPIYGPLQFVQNPYVGNLHVEGSVNGVPPSNVYHLQQGAIPPVVLKEMLIESALDIGEINNMNLSYLLENRLTKHDEALEVFGFLTFENLNLNKEIRLQSINDIPIDNLVFEKSEHLQAIAGTKTIEGDLLLHGPTQVMHLNGVDLMGAHQRTLYTDRDYQLGTVCVDEATFESGLILTESGKSMGERSALQSKRLPFENLKENLQKIPVRRQLKYLDYAADVVAVRQPANASVSETFVYQMKHSNACEHFYTQVQASGPNFFVSNFTSNSITDSLHDLSVKAENYCQHQYRKVKSKITLSSKTLLKVFGMKKHIESVRIFALKPREHYVLVHGVSAPTDNHNEVRLLKVTSTNDVRDMHSLSVGVGRVVRLFTHGQQVTLLSKSALRNHPAVNVYLFSEAADKFKLIQTIQGDYDLIEMADVPSNRLQVILGCRQCQRLNIYELATTADDAPYRIMQIVKVPTPIERLHVFRMADGQTYMLVVAAHGYDYYHLYRYSYIKGWTELTYGYYENLKIALPLLKNGRNVYAHVLLLLCGDVECAAVRAL